MRADRVLRALAVLAAGASVLADAPGWARVVLLVLAVEAVAGPLVRRRGRGAADAALVGTGALLGVLVLTGIALHLVGAPLRASGWVLALGGIGLVVVAVTPQDTAALPRPPRREVLRLAPWLVAGAGVLATAIALSVSSVDRDEDVPLQMSLVGVSGTSASVVVTAASPTGLLALRTDSDTGSGFDSATSPTRTSEPFQLSAGGSVRTSITVPASGRVVVALTRAGQSQTLLTLVVDR